MTPFLNLETFLAARCYSLVDAKKEKAWREDRGNIEDMKNEGINLGNQDKRIPSKSKREWSPLSRGLLIEASRHFF